MNLNRSKMQAIPTYSVIIFVILSGKYAIDNPQIKVLLFRFRYYSKNILENIEKYLLSFAYIKRLQLDEGCSVDVVMMIVDIHT